MTADITSYLASLCPQTNPFCFVGREGTDLLVRFVLRPGHRSFVRCEMRLPDDWNGVFLGLGSGGLGGYLAPDLVRTWADRGYAAVYGDLGTSSGDLAGIGNPDMWRDFGWRASHEMTVAGKEIVRLCYGRAPAHSYFSGASTGGQQAFALAQRFPLDYDGIVAGVPAFARLALHTYFAWNYVSLHDPQGQPLLRREDVGVIARAAVDFMQARGDGVPGDRFVSYPRCDRRTVEAFLAFLETRLPLTEAQKAGLFALYWGPHDPVTGRRIYGGFPMGAEEMGCGFYQLLFDAQAPFWYPYLWAFGEGKRASDLDFHADYRTLCRTLGADLDATSPDLSAFRAAGGKMLVYSGSADPCVPFHETVRYQRSLRRRMGARRADECFRFFLFPGKDHSNRGPGVNRWRGQISGGHRIPPLDELDVLRRWVEEGEAPTVMLGEHVEADGTVTLSRPVHCR